MLTRSPCCASLRPIRRHLLSPAEPNPDAPTNPLFDLLPLLLPLIIIVPISLFLFLSSWIERSLVQRLPGPPLKTVYELLANVELEQR
ncbi:MAG: hypothetical protein HC837_21265 [Chloroflexaceae bacterium]|nr:hypothetical protein [Chloroflexaceae bacterium]